MGIFDLVGDIVKIAVAPLEIAVDVTRIVTKPLADVATATVKEIKEGVEELIHD